jgi:hypothetical protein
MAGITIVETGEWERDNVVEPEAFYFCSEDAFVVKSRNDD